MPRQAVGNPHHPIARFHNQLEKDQAGPYRDAWVQSLDRAYEFQRQLGSSPYHLPKNSRGINIPTAEQMDFLNSLGDERQAKERGRQKWIRGAWLGAFLCLLGFLVFADLEELGTGLETMGGTVKQIGGGYHMRSHIFDNKLPTEKDLMAQGLKTDLIESNVSSASKNGTEGDLWPVENATQTINEEGGVAQVPIQDGNNWMDIAHRGKECSEKPKRLGKMRLYLEKAAQAITAGLRVWAEGEKAGETYPGAAENSATEVARATLSDSGLMLWPSEIRKAAMLDYTVRPKLLLFSANFSYGGGPSLIQQLDAQGWEYYMVGEEVSREFPGSYMRTRALHLMAAISHPAQVIVLADSSDVQALLTPEDFMGKYERMQGKHALWGSNSKVIFAAKVHSTRNPWKFLNPPGIVFEKFRGVTQAYGEPNFTSRSLIFPRRDGIALKDTDGSYKLNEQFQHLEQLLALSKRSQCGRALNCEALWDFRAQKIAQEHDIVRSPQSAQWQYTYMDAGFLTGQAAFILKMLQLINIQAGEDDQLLFEEYWMMNNETVALDYNGEVFATTQAYPTLGNSEQNGWKYVCNVEAVTRDNSMKFCHNLLRSCPVFVRTAGTKGKNFQCLQQMYSLWHVKSACGVNSAPPEQVLVALGRGWNHSSTDDGLNDDFKPDQDG